jgi:hypothetical protein
MAGRQAGEQLVVGRQAFGWYVGRQRKAGLVRRSCLRSGGRHGGKAGRRMGSRLDYRRTEGRHADRSQAIKCQVAGSEKINLFLYKKLEHLQESGIPTNLNILFHFGIVTIYHEMRF